MTPAQLAWAALMGAARVFAATENDDTRRELSRTAIEYGKVRVPKPTGVSDHRATEAVFRFGNKKGAPLSGASQRDLEWYRDALEQSIADPQKARWLKSNQAELDAVETALEAQ